PSPPSYPIALLPSVLLSPSFFLIRPAPPAPSSLPLHDALPISGLRAAAGVHGRHPAGRSAPAWTVWSVCRMRSTPPRTPAREGRSEEHTSELQSLTNLVCRLLLEKKKKLRAHGRI